MESLINKKLEEIERLLKQQSFLNKTVLTLEEAANYLSLSKSSLYKITSNKQISYYNPGGKKIYFRKSDLDNWIFGAKIESTQDDFEGIESYLLQNSKRP